MNFVPNISDKRGRDSGYVDIFTKLLDSRIIALYGKVSQELSVVICTQLILLDTFSQEEITIYINSPGGEIYSALAICDVMKSCKSKIKTVCIGMAFSCASLILCMGNKRSASPNSRIMIHQGRQVTSGYSRQTEEDLRVSFEELKFLNDVIKKFYLDASKGKLSPKDFDELFNTDSFFSPDKGLQLGLIDEIF